MVKLQKLWPVIVKNCQHQPDDNLISKDGYEFMAVEFDDQGACYSRSQMRALELKLESMANVDAIVILFVHGWKHNARPDDGNLQDFQDLVLAPAVRKEAEDFAADPQGRLCARPVLGIFVGWRGLSVHGRFNLIDNISFFNRQEAARRVSVGSVRELFGRLHNYREGRAKGQPLVVIVGHSFGGMIVFSALAQSLIEAAAMSPKVVIPRFCDMVLLVNPAIEASRFLPIFALIGETRESRVEQQPVFVCVTAKNDWATRYAFVVANAFAAFWERTRCKLQRHAIMHTLGHLREFRTHELSKANGPTPWVAKSLIPDEKTDPYWIIRSDDPSIINGHNGIFQPPFLNFIANQVFRHINESKKTLATRLSEAGQRVPQ